MNDLNDLITFLRARLDEDEKDAVAASIRGTAEHWRWVTTETDTPVPPGGLRAALEEECVSLRSVELYPTSAGPLPSFALWSVDDYSPAMDHVARHDPARVLAEVNAKRQIIAEHAILHRNVGWLADGAEEYGEIPVCGRCVPKHSHYSRRADVPEGWCRTLRLLALPYANHPDYRVEWRP